MIHILHNLASHKLLDIDKPENILAIGEDIANLPFHLYWKDRKGKYLGSNHAQANDAGYKDGKDILGLTDSDLRWSSYAPQLRKHDEEVMIKRESKTFFEHTTFPDGDKLKALSYKFPLRGHNKKIIGIIGLSFVIDDQLIIDLNQFDMLRINGTKDGFSPAASICKKVQSKVLTNRQKQCLHYLVKGYAIKEIAAELNLSPRTIGHYLDAIKDKLDCNSRAELIIKGIKIIDN